MAAPAAYPHLLIQNDWDEVLTKDDDGKVWISCKTFGSPAIYGTLESAAQKKNPPRLTSSSGFSVDSSNGHDSPYRSIQLSHFDPNCRCRFIAPVATFRSIHEGSMMALDVSEGGLGVAACTGDKLARLYIWDTEKGVLRRPFDGDSADVYTCRFFPSGVVVLSGGADMRLKVWSAETGHCAATMEGHISSITDTSFVERGRNVVSVSKDYTARLWDCSTTDCVTVLAKTNCQINGCDLAEASVTPEVTSDTTPNQFEISTPENEIGTDGKLLLMACEDGTFRAVDIRSREMVFSIACSSPVTCCCFLTSTEVACGRRDGVIMKVDIRAPSRIVHSWLDSSAAVLGLRPHSSGVLAGKADGLCVLYNGAGHDTIQLTGPDCDPISGVAFNKRHIFTCSRDGAIRKYSV